MKTTKKRRVNRFRRRRIISARCLRRIVPIQSTYVSVPFHEVSACPIYIYIYICMLSERDSVKKERRRRREKQHSATNRTRNGTPRIRPNEEMKLFDARVGTTHSGFLRRPSRAMDRKFSTGLDEHARVYVCARIIMHILSLSLSPSLFLASVAEETPIFFFVGDMNPEAVRAHRGSLATETCARRKLFFCDVS